MSFLLLVWEWRAVPVCYQLLPRRSDRHMTAGSCTNDRGPPPCDLRHLYFGLGFDHSVVVPPSRHQYVCSLNNLRGLGVFDLGMMCDSRTGCVDGVVHSPSCWSFRVGFRVFFTLPWARSGAVQVGLTLIPAPPPPRPNTWAARGSSGLGVSLPGCGRSVCCALGGCGLCVGAPTQPSDKPTRTQATNPRHMIESHDNTTALRTKQTQRQGWRGW